MNDVRPPDRPYGDASPSYGAAPAPGVGGYDPYAASGAAGAGPGPGSAGPSGPGPGYQAPPGWNGQPPPAPQQRTPRGVLIGIGAVVVLVTAAAIGWFVWPGWGSDPGAQEPTATVSPSPSSADPTSASGEPTDDPTTPSPDPTTTGAGPDPSAGQIDADGRMDGPGYSYAVPAGWSLDQASGDHNDGMVSDGNGSEITVYRQPSMAFCEGDAEALQIWVPGTLAVLADRDIGGVTATGDSLTGDEGDYYEIYCVEVQQVIYEISLQTTTSAQGDAQPLFLQALDSWTWG